MNIREGSVVIGTISGIKDYGAFVKVGSYDGLIHISEFSDHFVREIEHFVNIGDSVELKVIEVDEKNHRLRLSFKAIHQVAPAVLKHATVELGFQSLEDNLEDWIEKAHHDLKCNK